MLSTRFVVLPVVTTPVDVNLLKFCGRHQIQYEYLRPGELESTDDYRFTSKSSDQLIELIEWIFSDQPDQVDFYISQIGELFQLTQLEIDVVNNARDYAQSLNLMCYIKIVGDKLFIRHRGINDSIGEYRRRILVGSHKIVYDSDTEDDDDKFQLVKAIESSLTTEGDDYLTIKHLTEGEPIQILG